jgi:hypothetical protein
MGQNSVESARQKWPQRGRPEDGADREEDHAMTIIRRIEMAAVLLGLMAWASTRAEASLITFSESATFVGTLGRTSFINAEVTFTQTADTNNVILFDPIRNIYEVANSTATVTISGGNLASPLFATLTVPTITVSNESQGYGGLALASDQSVILVIDSPSFAGYDLQSPITINGNAFTADFSRAFATDQGDLIFTNSSGFSTFIATVPEPSSLALCGIAGAFGLGVARLRHKHDTAWGSS